MEYVNAVLRVKAEVHDEFRAMLNSQTNRRMYTFETNYHSDSDLYFYMYYFSSIEKNLLILIMRTLKGNVLLEEPMVPATIAFPVSVISPAIAESEPEDCNFLELMVQDSILFAIVIKDSHGNIFYLGEQNWEDPSMIMVTHRFTSGCLFDAEEIAQNYIYSRRAHLNKYLRVNYMSAPVIIPVTVSNKVNISYDRLAEIPIPD